MVAKRMHDSMSSEWLGTSKKAKRKTNADSVYREVASLASKETEKTTKPHGKDAKLLRSITESAQQGQSSTAKDGEQKKTGKKAVFRPILASPFAVDWPAVNSADGSAIYHTLLELLRLEDVQKIVTRDKDGLGRTSARKTKEKNQRRKARLLLNTLYKHGIKPTLKGNEAPSSSSSDKHEVDASKTEQKPILCGLNSVTRLLEGSIADRVHNTEQRHSGDDVTAITRTHRPAMIFVCHSDISPSALVAHLPMLVATYNALCDGHTKLIRLPADSETGLSDSVRLRRCSILSLDLDALSGSSDSATSRINDSISALTKLLDQCRVPETRMPWLEQAAQYLRPRATGPPTDLLQPRIKHVRTSIPADMNSAKAAKKARREGRRQKRRARIASTAKGKG